jgi:hypothetical protein
MHTHITATELALREELKELLLRNQAEVEPLAAAFDTALDEYINQACLGDIARREHDSVFAALLAITARLMLLRETSNAEATA